MKSKANAKWKKLSENSRYGMEGRYETRYYILLKQKMQAKKVQETFV